MENWIYPVRFEPQGIKNFVPGLKLHTQMWSHVGPYLLGVIIGYLLEHKPSKFGKFYRKYAWLISATFIPAGLLQYLHPFLLDPLISAGQPHILVGLLYTLDSTFAAILFAVPILYVIHYPRTALARFCSHPLFTLHQKLMLSLTWLHFPLALGLLSLMRTTLRTEIVHIVSTQILIDPLNLIKQSIHTCIFFTPCRLGPQLRHL